MTDRFAYKILTVPQWAQWQSSGDFTGAPADIADGYIHLSTAAQVTQTVDKHFAGKADLVVVAVDLAALGENVRWEPSRGNQMFPHVYAPLPLGAAVAAIPLGRNPDMTVTLPPTP